MGRYISVNVKIQGCLLKSNQQSPEQQAQPTTQKLLLLHVEMSYKYVKKNLSELSHSSWLTAEEQWGMEIMTDTTPAG